MGVQQSDSVIHTHAHTSVYSFLKEWLCLFIQSRPCWDLLAARAVLQQRQAGVLSAAAPGPLTADFVGLQGAAFGRCSVWAPRLRLPGARAQAQQGRHTGSVTPRMRDIPRSWTKLASPALMGRFFFFFIISFFFKFYLFIFFSGFCHTLTWISHGYTCVPHPDPPSHLPLHPIPLGLPSAPGPSICLMHPTWAGDLFHLR